MGLLKSYLAFIFVIFIIVGPSFGQKKRKNKHKINVKQVPSTAYTYGDSRLFDFPNVNKLLYYSNLKDIRKIRHYDEHKDWQKLYPLLRNYVSQFGIENFYKSTYWLWRLAKLTELFGDPNEAKHLYYLALKHYRNNLNLKEIELFYDSVKSQTQHYYVPIDYYYELVEYRKQVDTLRPPRGILLNMGHAVNSDKADYGPVLSQNDKLLIFTTKRDILRNPLDQTPIENLYYSRLYGEAWEVAEPLKDINTDLNEGSACLSKDGKELFFARCEAPDGFGNCDIYMAKMQQDSTWGKVTNLGPNVNGKGWDSHPSLTLSDDTLYFASDRLGGFGLSDIYYTVRDKNNQWQPSKNAGPIINTRQNEVSPFYHHKENVLYFSSNGQLLNFGEYDIYKTYKKKGNWVEPKNIGPLVNGPGSEFYFTIDSKSEKLYYARSAENNLENLDLYSFPLPMEAQPTANTRLMGKVRNEETGEAVQGIVSIIDLDKGIEVAPKYLKPDGSFEFNLINNTNYLFIVQGESFFRIARTLHLENETEVSTEIKPLSTKIKFKSIVFENGEATLTEDMYDDLDKVADFLMDNPQFKLRISGHTDSDGREAFNLKLSQERADAIMEYLVFFGGVDESRISAKGYGSSQPIVKDTTEEAKKLNRRVEFELYRK